MSDDIKAKVLAFVNRELAALGRPTLAELPKGIRSDSCECPIGRALTGGGYHALTATRFTSLVLDGTFEQAIDHPEVVADFVKAFDAGEYPELELVP